MPVSIDIEGSVHDPDWNSWLYGASAPVVVGAPKAAFQPEAEGLGVERYNDIAVCRDRVLDRRKRIAAVPQQLRVQQRLLRLPARCWRRACG